MFGFVVHVKRCGSTSLQMAGLIVSAMGSGSRSPGLNPAAPSHYSIRLGSGTSSVGRAGGNPVWTSNSPKGRGAV